MSILKLIKSSASSTALSHSSLFIILVQRKDVKRLFIPGAILAAIIAASIGNVPLPQNGSISIRSNFQGVSIISAAANVSDIGAFPAAGL